MKSCFCIFVVLDFALLTSTKEFTADFDLHSNRVPRNAQDGALTPVSLHIASKISSRFANTLVTSSMENNSTSSQEARFIVQLPETAFISNFSMVVDGKVYVGTVKERNVARDEFLEAKNKNLSAGLVSQSTGEGVRGMDKFEIAFNVAPSSTAEFRLNYQQLLERKRGYYEQVISVRPKVIIPLLKVVIDIEELQVLRSVSVMKIRKYPSDAVETNPLAVVQSTSPKSVHIEYSPSEEEQKKLGATGVFGDFIVRYDVYQGDDAGIVQVLGSYFVQFFSPSGLNTLPKEVVFVIDVSGSMSGTKIEQTRQAMHAILGQLHSDDSFNIVLFSGQVSQWKTDPSLTTLNNILEARAFVDKRVQAEGRTDINKALVKALSLMRNTVKVPIILFLTDGDPTAGETRPSTIRANVLSSNQMEVSIFALGFGFNLDFDFLRALSAENGGTAHRIYPEKDAVSQLEGIYQEISTPLLQRINFRYPKEIVDEAYTTTVSFGRYYQGSELIVCGKLKTDVISSLMSVAISGHAENGPVTYSLSRTLNELTVASDKVVIKDFTERLWAYKRIKELLVQLLVSNNGTEQIRLKAEALRLSLQYNFVTPLTSIVVVQSDSHLDDDVIASRSPGPGPGWSRSAAGLLILFHSFFLVELYM